MILPTLHDIKSSFRLFVESENLSWGVLFRPGQVLGIFVRYRFTHFLIVGGSGVAINLALTWLLTTFVFGLERYFIAYLFGLVVNLIFNFTMYSITIFRTSKGHARRLLVFLVYILAVTALQAGIVKTVTPLVGLQFYLLVIAGVIGAFSLVNFIIFKLSIFNER